MIDTLIINGCSYNEVYAAGPGPKKLAQTLALSKAESIALGGSNNSRILRTTLKHSYQSKSKNLYLIGLTFLSRWELPIVDSSPGQQFEGRWINPQSQQRQENQIQPNWTSTDTTVFKDLMFKSSTWGIADLLEDLMYKCLATASDLHRRGHAVVFWNNCDDLVEPEIEKNSHRFELLNQDIFIDKLTWCAVPWQHQQGAKPIQYQLGTQLPPNHLHHIHPDSYQLLNQYLTDWIINNKILS
jgi:hypothetical protein